MKKLLFKEVLEEKNISTTVLMARQEEVDISLDELKHLDCTINKAEGKVVNNFYIDGRKIICIIDCGGGIKIKGVAKCHPDDKFNLALGMKLAVAKARIKMYSMIIDEL